MSGTDVLILYRQRILQNTAFLELAELSLLRDNVGDSAPLRIPASQVSFRIQALQKGHKGHGDGHGESSYFRDHQGTRKRLTDVLTALNRFGEEFYRRGQVYRALERPTPVPPQEALQAHHRFVLLGASGSGKSALLRHLAWKAAQDPEGALPIFVSLKEYSLYLATQGTESLCDFALNTAARGNKALRERLKEAEQVLWLLDDLDRVWESRVRIIAKIHELTGSLVLTSRPVGYQSNGLEALPHYEILPLLSEETTRVCHHVLTLIAEFRKRDQPWRQEQLNTLQAELTRHTESKNISLNPFCLTLAVILSAEHHLPSFPQRRADLYHFCLQALLKLCSQRPAQSEEAPPRSSGEVSSDVPDDIALHSLYYLGWSFYQACYGGMRDNVFDQEIVREDLSQYLAGQNTEKALDWKRLSGEVLECWQKTGVLKVFSLDNVTCLSFRHSALQEYAAARHIARMYARNPQQTWKFLSLRLHHPAWHEVILMLAGVLDEERSSAFVMHLLKGSSPYERGVYRDLRLAVSLMNEGAPLKNNLCQHIIQRLSQLNFEYREKYTRFSRLVYSVGLLGICIALIFTRTPSILEYLVTAASWSLLWYIGLKKSIAPRLQGIFLLLMRLHRYLPDREFVIQLFEQCHLPETVPYLSQALFDNREDVRRVAAEALGQVGNVESVAQLIKGMHDSRQHVRRSTAYAIGHIGDISALIQVLYDEQSQIRQAAAEALVKVGKNRAIPELARALDDERDYVHHSAIDALKQIGTAETVPHLIKALENSDSIVRQIAAEALGQIGEPEAIPALVNVLHDQDWTVRWASAYALGQIGDPSVVPALLQALRENSDSVNRAYADALLRLVNANSFPDLFEALQDRSASVRTVAVKALGKLGKPDIVPHLAELLHDHDKRIRRNVAETLGRIGDPKAMVHLIEHLADQEWWVRWACAEALGAIGEPDAVPYLMHMLKDSNGYVCRSAAEALGRIGGTEAVPFLIQALKSKKTYVHRTAEEALKRIGEVRTVPYLIEALKDEQDYVRKDAEDALREIEDARAVPYLIQALQDQEEYVRRTAAEALGRIGEKEAIAHLIPLLDDRNDTIRSAVAEALGVIGDNEVISPLMFALHDQSSNVRRAAAKALGRIGGDQAVFPLIRTLKDQNTNVRRAAVESLGRMGDPEAVPVLIEALQDTGWWVRWSAAYALGRIGDIRAVLSLIKMLREDNNNVRRAAAEALGQIAEPQAVQPLMKALSDDDWSVRWSIAYALGQIGEIQAVPQLIQLLIDENSKVRWASAEALGKIGSVQAAPHLIQALQDSNWDVRKAAARSLSQISAAEEIPYLFEAMRKPNEYVRRTTMEALRQIHDMHAIPFLIQGLKDEDEYIREAAADNLIRIGGDRAIVHLMKVLNHDNWYVRKMAAEILGHLSPVTDNQKLLKRAARALWWRLTDVDSVAKAAFHALDQVAARLSVVKVNALACMSPARRTPKKDQNTE